MAATAATTPPQRILLVRTSALGDLVHCLPVATALARHLPEAKIAWVVEEVWAPLLAGHPALDRVIPVRTKAWRKTPGAAATQRDVLATVRELRSFGADVALDLMGNHKGGVLTRLSGARRRIGLDRTSRREPSSALWVGETVPARGVHAVERALSLLSALGLPEEPADFGGDSLLSEAVADGEELPDGPFALLHPGAGWGNKVYPAERWGEVARLLADSTGLATAVALSPSPAERALAEVIVATASGAARPVEAGSLASLVALSRRARLVLGGDTGPIHLAHALGTPVLCLLGPTDPARHGPWGAPDSSLARVLPCSFCYRRFDTTKACLLELTPTQVAERAARLLGDGG